MPDYRIYLLGKNNHIGAPPKVYEFAEDHEAINQANMLLNGYDVEVWQGNRKVITLQRQSKTPN